MSALSDSPKNSTVVTRGSLVLKASNGYILQIVLVQTEEPALVRVNNSCNSSERYICPILLFETTC